tara:strand:+ start:2264 stop:3370 length:1107 start_codon:yes stop_codon:yes gene_type:complete
LYIKERLNKYLDKNTYLLADYLSPVKTNKHKLPIFINKNSNLFYTKLSQFEAIKQFNIKKSFYEYFLPQKKINCFASIDLIIYLSLNGLVLIIPSKKIVLKIVDSSYESNFMSLELNARKIYGKHNTVKILKTFQTNNYFGIIYEYIPRVKMLENNEEWSKCLDRIFHIQLHNSSISFYLSQKLYEKTKLEIKLASESDNFSLCPKNLIKKILNLLSKYYVEDILVPIIDVHGDLTINNVLHTKNSNYYIDFANGGKHVFVYDLMIQEFYKSKNSLLWKNFDKFDFINSADPRVFFGLSGLFFKKAKKIKKIDHNNDVIKFFFILSLCELLVKNCKRYQSGDDTKGGYGMMGNLNLIIDCIVGSFHEN